MSNKDQETPAPSATNSDDNDNGNDNNNMTRTAAGDGISNYTPLQKDDLSPVMLTYNQNNNEANEQKQRQQQQERNRNVTSPISILDNDQIPYDSVFIDDDDDDEMMRSPFVHDGVGRRSRIGTTEYSTASNNHDDLLTSPLLLLPQDHHGESLPINSSSSPYPELNGLNYLNGVTFVAHVFVSYGIGVWGLDGILPSGWDISQRYETLVTPAFYAYGFMWAPILVCEALFTTCQFTPWFRGRPIIQEGTSVFFFYTCVVQTAWTLFFAFRFFVISFVTVVLSLVSLIALITSQNLTQQQYQSRQQRTATTTTVATTVRDDDDNDVDDYDDDRRGCCGCCPSPTNRNNESWRYTIEYWLFRFPFILHCGWMIVMTAVHFSLLIRDLTSHKATQLASDMTALAFLLTAACICLYISSPKSGSTTGPDFVIPCVIVWAYIGIAYRLQHASLELQEEFDISTIHAVQQACWFLAGAVVCMMCPRIVIWACHNYFTIDVVEFQDG